MTWRYRQTFSIAPGLRLNLSNSGLSASIGGAPFTLNVGAHGLKSTASIPGSGLSYSHSFAGSDESQDRTALAHPHEPKRIFTNNAPIQEIHSASTELPTSASLQELKLIIENAYRQHSEICAELSDSKITLDEAEQKFNSWNEGFLFKRVFKDSFSKRRSLLEEATGKTTELEEQLRLSTITTHIEIEQEQKNFTTVCAMRLQPCAIVERFGI